MKSYTKTNCSFLQSRFSQKPASAKVTGTGNSLRKGPWESPIRKGSRKGSEQRQEEAGRIQGRVLAITWPLGSPERQTYRTVHYHIEAGMLGSHACLTCESWMGYESSDTTSFL